jgi:RNA polymerase sigma-70 factor (sigma-E family)
VVLSSDDEAFVAFVLGAQDRLHHLAWLLSGDVHRAEELVQETLVRAYGAWHRIGHEDPFAYARRILVNAKTDAWRRRSRELLVDQVPEDSSYTETLSDDVEVRRTVVESLATLARRERQVVVLRYYADLSEADTATELGISVGTVKSTASRALGKLRRLVVPTNVDSLPVGNAGKTAGSGEGL